METRRGANWTPPKKKSLVCFEAQQDSEQCMHCGREISFHYGSTEYRCKAAKPSDRMNIYAPKPPDVVGFVAAAVKQAVLVGSNSKTDIIRVVCAAIDIALQFFRWNEDDFAALVKRFSWRAQNGVVFGADYIDDYHRRAVGFGNVSAANSVDAKAKQPAMYGIDAKANKRIRLTVQSEIVLDGLVWTVTGLPYAVKCVGDEPRRVRICRYDQPASVYGRRPVERRVVTQAQLTPKEDPTHA